MPSEDTLGFLKSRRRHLAPSILSADFGRLSQDISRVVEAGATVMHFDVMDGHFVPNITVGPVVLGSLTAAENAPLFDVHLMISEPMKYFDDFIKAGAGMISFHIESDVDVSEALAYLKAKGVVAGVALNPDGELDRLMDEGLLEAADFILLMSVFPGFAGQKFIEPVLDKVSELRKLLDKKGLPALIEIDGGITSDNIAKVSEAGADIIVAGSAVFGADDISATTIRFLEAM